MSDLREDYTSLLRATALLRAKLDYTSLLHLDNPNGAASLFICEYLEELARVDELDSRLEMLRWRISQLESQPVTDQ